MLLAMLTKPSRIFTWVRKMRHRGRQGAAVRQGSLNLCSSILGYPALYSLKTII